MKDTLKQGNPFKLLSEIHAKSFMKILQNHEWKYLARIQNPKKNV